MPEILDYSSSHPAILMLGIILISYLLEDAAIVSAALLSIDSSLSYTSGLIAVFIGIASGDLFLYYIGLSSHKIPWAARRLNSPKGLLIQRKMNQNAFLSIFIIRFLPGVRGIGYLTCGALKVKVLTFILSILSASIIWCGLIYSAIHWLGDALWLTNSPWRWTLAPILILILWSANKKVNHSLKKEASLERT